MERVSIRMLALGLLCALAAGCATSSAYKGRLSPAEMRAALLAMARANPDQMIPEFSDSLKYDKPVYRDGKVYIGAWNCDPDLLTFEAVLTGPNITLYEVNGSFHETPRGNWEATLRSVRRTEPHEIGVFWRANEVDQRWTGQTGKKVSQ